MNSGTMKKLILKLFAAFGVLLAGAAGQAQSNPANSAANPYVGSVQAVPYTAEPKALSMDDAIKLGIQYNLALTLAREQQKQADAQKLELVTVLLPDITLHGETGVHQFNLEAEGFHPSIEAAFAPLLPPGTSLSSFHLITKVDTTIGQINFSQALFNWAGYDVWRASQAFTKAAYYNAQSARGLVVLNVGNTYLQALAAKAQLDYARSLQKTDETAFYQAHEEHLAGTAANLDELRAKVQLQSQQQAVIAAQDNFEKAKIALNREIGLRPEQPVTLTDSSPYAELHPMDLVDARNEAYANRQDYQALKQELIVADRERTATKHERFPTLTFGGNWGVTGISGGVYHGTFAAVGTLSIPIFKEAEFRGDRDVAEAQLEEIRTRLEDLKQKIDQQLRDSLLDLQTATETVQVAKSNVELATTALDQTQQRFDAGVSDNLPVAEAQSTLAAAQTQYVNSVYQLNETRLGLARNLGIIDTQYRVFLQGGNPPQVKSDQAVGEPKKQ
ncbi:MAG TPA: TolC family protein [Acidobacteriaceae bacterium]|nr:TolC family protein [Acidobacteriaceae bacterium]